MAAEAQAEFGYRQGRRPVVLYLVLVVVVWLVTTVSAALGLVSMFLLFNATLLLAQAVFILWSYPYEVAVEGDTLVWRTVLRTRRLPLAALRRVGPGDGWKFAVLETSDGAKPRLPLRKGFSRFCAALAERAESLQPVDDKTLRRGDRRGRRDTFFQREGAAPVSDEHC